MGRPRRYADAATLAERAGLYFQCREQDGVQPTVRDLRAFLGFSDRHALSEYARRAEAFVYLLGQRANCACNQHTLAFAEDLMLTLSARIDEAGCDGRSPVLIMGGFVASIPRWERFDAAWRKRLRLAGMTYFHATEFWGSRGETKGVSFPEKQALARRFWSAHDGKLMFGFCHRLDNADYKHYRETLASKEHRDSQYGLLFRVTVTSVVQSAVKYAKRQDIRIHFLLEEGHANAGDAARIFAEMKKHDGEMAQCLGVLNFGEKKRFPGLQAADGIIATGQRLEARNAEHYDAVDQAAELHELASDVIKTPIFRGHFTRADIDGLVESRHRFRELYRQQKQLDWERRKAAMASSETGEE